MITLIVDKRELTVKQGTNLLTACLQPAGVPVGQRRYIHFITALLV